MRAFVLTAVLLAGSQGSASAQVIQTKSLFSNGGAHSAVGSLTLTSNLGEALAGYSEQSPRQLWSGFYAPVPTQVVGVDDAPLVTRVSYLGRTTPTPARSVALIEFGVAVRQHVELSLYDVSGRRVRGLHAGELQAGVFRLPWDLRSDAGQRVSAGIYFLRLSTPDLRATDRVVVTR